MFKTARVGCIVLLAILAACLAASAKVDCDSHYKHALERVRQMHVSPERTVALSHQALRIYDACQTGDFEDAASFFEQLERWKN